MPNGSTDSDSTESDYPSRADNPFDGRKSEAEAQAEQAAPAQNGEQRETPDSTGNAQRAEPADSASDSSDREGAPSRGPEADSTAERPTEGDDPPENGEVDGQPSSEEDSPSEDAGTEAEGDAEDPPAEGADDPSEESDQPPFQYHGTEPEDEEHEDYVFISEVDPDQRYETVEDLVNGVENHIENSQRNYERAERFQERLTEVQSKMEGEVAELKAENALFRERLGDDDLVDMLADKHMPEKFQGLRRDEVADAEREEYLEARGAAKKAARDELEEMEQVREERQEQARERRENLNERVEEATEFLESVDVETLGLGDAENGEAIAAEAVNRLTNGDPGDENARTPFDLAHTLYWLPDVLPDEVDFGHEEAERAARMLAENAVRDEARRVREEKRQSRADKIRRVGDRRGTEKSGEEKPEKATETSAGREPKMEGNPFR